MWELLTCECPFHILVPSTRESRTAHIHGNSHVGVTHVWKGDSRVGATHMWRPLPHTSNSHTWMPPPHMSKSHTWMSPPHVSKSHTWMSPPHVSKSHTWMSLHHWGNATREGITVHVSHTWAVREGLLSTIEEMLHVRALPCMWATCELYVRGSPPPLRKCYMWGHYHACEPHVSCTWGAPLHHWGNAYMWGHYHACEPHVSCTWGAPLHHWGNATREGITVHVSHMWAVREGLPSTIEGMLHMRALPCTWATRDSRVCAQLPSTFQKKWPKNSPSTT